MKYYAVIDTNVLIQWDNYPIVERTYCKRV